MLQIWRQSRSEALQEERENIFFIFISLWLFAEKAERQQVFSVGDLQPSDTNSFCLQLNFSWEEPEVTAFLSIIAVHCHQSASEKQSGSGGREGGGAGTWINTPAAGFNSFQNSTHEFFPISSSYWLSARLLPQIPRHLSSSTILSLQRRRRAFPPSLLQDQTLLARWLQVNQVWLSEQLVWPQTRHAIVSRGRFPAIVCQQEDDNKKASVSDRRFTICSHCSHTAQRPSPEDI